MFFVLFFSVAGKKFETQRKYLIGLRSGKKLINFDPQPVFTFLDLSNKSYYVKYKSMNIT